MIYYLLKSHDANQNHLNNVNNNIQNTNGNWNVSNISFVNKTFDYNEQVSSLKVNDILKTKEPFDNAPYIKNVVSSAELGEINYLDNYTNMDSIKLINISNVIDNISNNYQYRYKKSDKEQTAWNTKNIEMGDYYLKNGDNEAIDISRTINDFSLKNKDNKIFDLITLIPNDIDLNLGNYDNGLFNLSINEYTQLSGDNLRKNEIRKQIVVDWTNEMEKYFIDDSTIDFWINLIMQPKYDYVSRIIVKPANLIIYRSNVHNKVPKISFNDKSSIPLFSNLNKNEISIDDWALSCINENPIDLDFDFRKSFSNQIHSIESISVPKIIHINENEYLRDKSYSEANQIAPYLLYGTKPNGKKDRNWGNDSFPNLTNLLVTGSSYAPNIDESNLEFNINMMNNVLDSSSYTNAIPNASFEDVGSSFFSNQFFVSPELKKFYTNNIRTYFKSYNFINNLIIYKSYNDNFSDSSFTRYKNLSILFLPEIKNENSSYSFTLNSILNTLPGNNLPIINTSSVDEYINNYLNFIKNNRDDTKTKFNYFSYEQNQWETTIVNNSLNKYNFNLFYDYNKYLNNLIAPFSLYKDIDKFKNPFSLLTNSNDHLSRIVDHSTGTIIYNSEIVINNNISPYPINYLKNNTFSDFINNKANKLNTNVIDITFQDWVDNSWMGISDDFDIVSVLKSESIKINTLFIPKILILNKNSVIKLSLDFFNVNLVIAISLIIITIIFILIEIALIIYIVKTPSKFNWAYMQAEEEFGF